MIFHAIDHFRSCLGSRMIASYFIVDGVGSTIQNDDNRPSNLIQRLDKEPKAPSLRLVNEGIRASGIQLQSETRMRFVASRPPDTRLIMTQSS